jgi:nucleoside-diphosphate-sugar epimerase
MRVLIIGGTKYMGVLSVERLLARGDQVTVFSRGNTKPAWWDRVDHINGDRNDRADFRAKLAGQPFDAVIDAVAFKKEDVETAHEVFLGRVGRYLMVSTGSVYMPDKVDYRKICPLKESDIDWAGIDYAYPEGADPYGWGKRHCEKWLQENSKVPFTVIRVPAVLGWNDATRRMWWWVQRALDGQGHLVPMENRGAFPVLYPVDAAENFIRALDAPAAANQCYHVTNDEIMFVERWAAHMSHAAGKESEIVFVPNDVIKRREVLKDYSPVLTRPVSTIWDTSKAKRDFGFRTTPTAEWIQKTVAWHRDEYKGFEGKPFNSNGYEHRAVEVEVMKKWKESFSSLMKSV